MVFGSIFCSNLSCTIASPWASLTPFFIKTGTFLIPIGLVIIDVLEYVDMSRIQSLFRKEK